MTAILDGTGASSLPTPLPVASGGTGASTVLGSGVAMLSPQTGSAPVYGCRAWCKFNGATTGTNAPTAGGNVSTVQRVSAGVYTITFSVALPDTDYALFASHAIAPNNIVSIHEVTAFTRTTTQCQIAINSNGTPYDSSIVNFQVIR